MRGWDIDSDLNAERRRRVRVAAHNSTSVARRLDLLTEGERIARSLVHVLGAGEARAGRPDLSRSDCWSNSPLCRATDTHRVVAVLSLSSASAIYAAPRRLGVGVGTRHGTSGFPIVSLAFSALRILIAAVFLSAVGVVATPAGADDAIDPYYSNFTANDGRVLRLFVVPGPTSSSPVVFVVHGGGFSQGEFDRLESRCVSMTAALPVACISPEYRLDSPAPRVLRQSRDVANAVTWVRDRASTYGIYPSRIALHGSSAGGTLVMLVNSIHGVSVRAIIDESGPTDFVNLDKDGGPSYSDGNNKIEQAAVGCADDTDTCRFKKRNHSPVTWARRNTAPTLIVHSDPELVNQIQGQRLKAALDNVAVPNSLVVNDGGQHAACVPSLDADWLRMYLLS